MFWGITGKNKINIKINLYLYSRLLFKEHLARIWKLHANHLIKFKMLFKLKDNVKSFKLTKIEQIQC